MHVLIVPATYPRFFRPLSGIFYRDQAVALARHGVTVGVLDAAARSVRPWRLGRVAGTRFQVGAAVTDDGVQTVEAHDWCLPYAPKMFAKQFLARVEQLFDRYVDRFGTPDILHAHEILWGGVAARTLAARAGIPYVITEHSGGYALEPIERWKLPSIRTAIEDAAALLTVSAELGSRMARFGTPRRTRVVPNIVDVDFFRPPASRAAAAGFRLVSIGSQDTNKGIDVLLQAFAAAFAGQGDVSLDIAGDGPERPRFEALARSLRLGAQVRWLGELSRHDVAACLRQADALALTSRYETFGVVLIEAMATGLPVIATRCGGPQDVVDDRCGELIDVDRVDQAAAAMKRVYGARDAWRRRAPAIRASVLERFEEGVVVRRLTAVYDECLGATAVKQPPPVAAVRHA